MNTEKLIDLIETAGYDVRTSYGGRGMYGKTCVAFDVEIGKEFAAVAEIMDEAEDEETRTELVKAFRSCRSDSMGRDGMVIYFPRMQTTE